MIIDENGKKKEEENEKLLTDLCECFFLLSISFISDELISICVPCLLKVVSKKEESEEAQKEVEIALLALSNISKFYEIKKELYLNEITEIIEYHQEHQNLTRLAYQSAWQFLIYRFHNDESLEDIIVNDLHSAREAAKELKELVKEESAGLIGGVVEVYRAAKGNNEKIGRECVFVFKDAAENRSVNVEELLKGGAVDVVLEGMQRQTFNEGMTSKYLHFFLNISERLKEKNKEEKEEIKRKTTKRKVFEKLEEEGHEDIIASHYGIFSFVNDNGYELSKNLEDYFMNV